VVLPASGKRWLKCWSNGSTSASTPHSVFTLTAHSIKVFIADRDLEGAQKLVAELNATSPVARCAHVDVANWNSQAKAFSQAVADFGRLDYVYPIAGVGERAWIPHDAGATGFERPDLTVVDVDLTGVLYTVGLAVQQFRKQPPGKHGFRGKS
jgi:NADP-dependent 3-hydroxy acid dehydrogenase YdfG